MAVPVLIGVVTGGVGVDATVVPGTGVVVVGEPELEGELDEGGVLGVAAAVCVPEATVPPLLGVVTSVERLIKPALGETSVAAESDADATGEPADPSPLPQAAKVSVVRAQSTTLRMCERASKAKCDIFHYPG
jgi:hypothetical protein